MSLDSNSDAMTTEDLRNRLFDLLKNKGLVGKLKSQLRNQLVVELRSVGLSESFAHGGGGGGGQDVDGESLPLRAVNSLVADHLKQAGYEYSLSIFLPESGMVQDKLLTTKDILQLLRISSQSKLHKSLLDHSVKHPEGFLWRLVKEIAAIRSQPTLECGIQTEASRMPCISIEEEFRKVDAYYSSLEDTGTSRVAAVEERILAYQRLLEERSRSEVEMAIARFKDRELARLRIEEREKNRKEMEKSRKEVELVFQAKHDALMERERHFTERMQKQNEMIEKENFTQRQTILQEIESVRQREAQSRRQEEINNRDKRLAEERLKSLEEIARRREENSRRAELEIDQRIRNEVEKFKVEEQVRYLDRLKNLEFREEKVKDNERRVGDELQEITHIKVELREKRGKVVELEAELIRVKHDLIGASKQNEMFSERALEMANYQNVKEESAVLRRELDNAKVRISELTRDVMIERQKHEDLLRELVHVSSKPTPEVALLRKQIEQLQLSLRTERSLADHTKLQMDQRLETEMDRNKQLLSKFQEQSWKQKEINWETRDLREQLLDHDRALQVKTSDLISRSESPCDLIGGGQRAHLPKLGDPSLYQNVVDPHLLFDSPRMSVDLGTSTHSEDCSFSSDLIRDTKKRLRRIDCETEKLDKWYQECHMRAIAITPALGPENFSLQSREGTPKANSTTFNKAGGVRASVTFSPASDSANFHGQMSSGNVRGSTGRNFRLESSQDQTDRNRSVNYFESKSSTTTTTKPFSSLSPADESPVRRKAAPGACESDEIKESIQRPVEKMSQPKESGASGIGVKEHVKDSDFWEQPEPAAIKESSSKEAQEAKHVVTEAGSNSFRIPPDADKKTADSATRLQEVADAERRRKEEEAEFEVERKRRMEERLRREEETWRREKEELEELQRQDQVRAATTETRASEKRIESQTEPEEPSEVSEASKEPEIDPELRKYMAIVRKKREEEKEKKEEETQRSKQQYSSVAAESKEPEDESVLTTDDVSAPDDRSDFEASGDDW